LETGDGNQSTHDSILTGGGSLQFSSPVTAAQVTSSSEDEDSKDNSPIFNQQRSCLSHEELLKEINTDADEIIFLLEKFIVTLGKLIGDTMSCREFREDLKEFSIEMIDLAHMLDI
jgi:hypothetical protein